MQLSLPADIQKLIDDRVTSGQYGSVEDVISAAIFSLHQQESLIVFAPGALDALIAEGERDIVNGRVLGMDEAFENLQRRHAGHPRKKP